MFCGTAEEAKLGDATEDGCMGIISLSRFIGAHTKRLHFAIVCHVDQD
jgi:hypothetical protein